MFDGAAVALSTTHDLEHCCTRVTANSSERFSCEALLTGAAQSALLSLAAILAEGAVPVLGH